jgi:hypothetical protein
LILVPGLSDAEEMSDDESVFSYTESIADWKEEQIRKRMQDEQRREDVKTALEWHRDCITNTGSATDRLTHVLQVSYTMHERSELDDNDPLYVTKEAADLFDKHHEAVARQFRTEVLLFVEKDVVSSRTALEVGKLLTGNYFAPTLTKYLTDPIIQEEGVCGKASLFINAKLHACDAKSVDLMVVLQEMFYFYDAESLLIQVGRHGGNRLLAGYHERLVDLECDIACGTATFPMSGFDVGGNTGVPDMGLIVLLLKAVSLTSHTYRTQVIHNIASRSEIAGDILQDPQDRSMGIITLNRIARIRHQPLIGRLVHHHDSYFSDDLEAFPAMLTYPGEDNKIPQRWKDAIGAVVEVCPKNMASENIVTLCSLGLDFRDYSPPATKTPDSFTQFEMRVLDHIRTLRSVPVHVSREQKRPSADSVDASPSKRQRA